jgi:hypothetical protein
VRKRGEMKRLFAAISTSIVKNTKNCFEWFLKRFEDLSWEKILKDFSQNLDLDLFTKILENNSEHFVFFIFWFFAIFNFFMAENFHTTPKYSTNSLSTTLINLISKFKSIFLWFFFQT